MDANFLRLLNQLREGQHGEGNPEDDGNGMEDMIQRFMQRLQGAQPPTGPPSPQNALDEKMYQAARAGDLSEMQQAIRSGTPSLGSALDTFLPLSPFCCLKFRSEY